MCTPPEIPAARADSARGPIPTRPLLVWVRTGVAHVDLHDAGTLHLSDGEGVWIPAGGHRRIVTEPGTIAFPLLPQAGVGEGVLSAPTRFEVPEEWQDWLIQHFNLQVTPLSGSGYSHDTLVDLLRRPGSRPSAPAPGRNSEPSTPEPSTLLDPPPIPSAGGARTVAEELARDPSLDLTVEEWASRTLSSPSTLRRDFLSGTGLTFEQWRQHCRLNAAVELLAAGYDVDQVAGWVGFASRNGFTRAFTQRFGPTPHEFRRRLAAGPLADELAQHAAAARQADDLVRMVRSNTTPVAAPDLLPPARTPPHANHIHVLSWMYRGSGYLDIGDRRYERQRGIATWIPAELEHTTGLRENSISLPLGTAGTADLQLSAPLHVYFSPAWDDYLMFCAISARSIFRPDDYDPGHILTLFTEQVAAQRALAVPMPSDPRAREAAMSYLRRLSTADGSAAFDVPADIRRAFLDETGMTFARWCYAARMRIARDLLTGGAKPRTVARRVGYAHLPTFSAAFSRFHGLSPRDYQEQHLTKD